jgi:RNA polymerase sigma-70 factor (ECF subfamily)
MHTTPVSLLEQLRQPDPQAAWGRFVALYTPLLLSWARRSGLQDSDAADLVQDVFAVLVQKLPEFHYDSRKSFRAWLRTILLNRWRNQQRARHGRPREDDPTALDGVAGPDGAADLEEDEYRKHLVGRTLELIRNDFQPATWKAFWECQVAGRPAAEVAAELGLNAGTVRAARFRVLCRLRQELEGLLD